MKLTMKEHGARIQAGLSGGESYRQIASHLGCRDTTVGAFVKVNFPELRRAVRTNQYTNVTKALPDQPTELELLKAELAEARTAQRKHRTIDVQAERLLHEVRELVVPADVKYETPDVAEGDGKAHMQVLLLSDLHVGEVVEPEAVNGLNEYNWEVFKERMAALQRALFSFQNNRPYPIDELLIACLGDNVSNNHHKELAVTNEFPITEQCYRGGLFLGQWIEELVPHYPKIRVVGVGGNHGRVDQKPSSKHVFDSFDWLGYQYAKQHLSKYDIEFHTPRSGMIVTEVAGRNMLVWHGDGVRSSMPGVPWGGVMRRVNELKKQYSEAGVMIDYVTFGHYHQANVIQGNLFGNGSIMGLNEYGLKNFGSGEKPTQLLLTFNRDKRRLTDVSFITP
jgi:DNA repair exonuclease SbcCD nuclease subunit